MNRHYRWRGRDTVTRKKKKRTVVREIVPFFSLLSNHLALSAEHATQLLQHHSKREQVKERQL